MSSLLNSSLLLIRPQDDNSSRSKRLKYDLLLTHGTIYGVINESLEAVQFDGINISIENSWSARTKPFYAPYASIAETAVSGTMTNNVPIEVVSWGVTGAAPANNLWPWQSCVTLLTRM